MLTGIGASSAEFYSPPVRDDFPDAVLWGDTHLHTYLSGDAFGMGTRMTPEDAYRFAKGEAVTATGGETARLKRPLDFLLVADHAESLGNLPRLLSGDARLAETAAGKRWTEFFAHVPTLRELLNAPDLKSFNEDSNAIMAGKAAANVDYGIDDGIRLEVWHEVVDAAERHNDPGTFTAFAGYEYSSNPPMLHRNVLYVGGPEHTRQTRPFSKFDSPNPEDLWAYLDEYEKTTGSGVISIPHNSNLSGGQMFSPRTYGGDAMTVAYAQIRADREPVLEVTQIKGDSETHPLASPQDGFADYETFYTPPTARTGQTKKPSADAVAWANQSYARPALKRGLGIEAELGVNPFKFGMIGSTDSHNGLATAAEDNFWGKMANNEPSPYRAYTLGVFASSGYAGVWAEANTREAIFAAFKRREVYATTGPRITLRFFGGWEYTTADAHRPDFARTGYARGVPMGGDLTNPPTDRAPGFLIRAVKEPDGANLDRIQVIKGWRDETGTLHERVHDVAWSGDRKVGADGVLLDVASTVDLATGSYTNTVGTAELAVTWTDPDFNVREAAVYYVRVIQIPTPRWTGYDAAFYGLTNLPEHVPLTTRERAYSSPIWYSPGGRLTRADSRSTSTW